MSLMNCPACRHQVSKAAHSCPQCGHPFVPSNAIQDTQTGKKKFSDTLEVVKGVGIIGVLIAFLSASQWFAKILALIIFLAFGFGFLIFAR